MKFRKKPVVIQAIQWTGDTKSLNQIDHALVDDESREIDIDGDRLFIHTLEGVMTASKGDWIIKGVQGELYPCKPDIFEQTYEPIE